MSDYKEVNISLGDGYDAYARFWPVDKPIGAVLYLHGIQSHCGWYTDTARAMQQAGFAVLQPDRRGSGRNKVDRGHADSSQQLIDDAMAYSSWLTESTGSKRIHVIGVSWGGKLAAAMHVTNPELMISLTMVAPGVFPIVDVSASEKFKIGWSMVSNPEKLYDIPLNDPELFTDKPKWIEFLKNDEYQIHQASAGFYLASRRMDKVVAKFPDSSPVPVQLFLASDERIIDNEKTSQWIHSLPWPDKYVTTYEHSRHTLEFGDDKEQFTGDLIVWLSRNASTV